MNKWALGIATAALLGLGGIVSHIMSGWVDRVNSDHEILKQMWYKDQFLNGQVRAAPVEAPKK